MQRTPLHDLHVRLNAKMVEFAGWELPVVYSGILDEHRATREHCTLFDVSHMGRLYLSGSEASSLLEHLCTRRLGNMQPGQCRYSHMCNEGGGVLDDVIVFCLEDQWLVVCNASNRGKISHWINSHAVKEGVQVEDRTADTVMVAIQGPQAAALADELLPFTITDLGRYRLKAGRFMGIEYLCARTGYTGEDGFEFIVPVAAGKMLAANIVEPDGDPSGRVKPAGLGARDTLRLEAGFPLYGHELSEQIDSITAGQAWCVDLEKEFIGCEALRRIQQEGIRRKLVGLEVQGKRIARQHALVLKGGQQVGAVTSGTMSPTLGKVIAMAYVEVNHAEMRTELDVDIRGKISKARIVPLPFYKREA